MPAEHDHLIPAFDPDVFFDPLTGFSQEATTVDGLINVIYRAGSEIIEAGEYGIEGAAPYILYVADSYPSAARGQAVEIGGQVFQVTTIEPNNTGVHRAYLTV